MVKSEFVTRNINKKDCQLQCSLNMTLYKKLLSHWLLLSALVVIGILSYQLNQAHMRDFCSMLGIEFVHIGKHTDIDTLTRDLMVNDLVWRLQRA